MKKCSKCGEVKPIADFRKDSSKRDGRRGYCKTCHKNINAAWAAAHQDMAAAAKRKWKQRNKEKVLASRAADAERAKQRAALWYKQNKERALLASADYQRRHRERVRLNQSAWRERNVEKKRAYDARYWRDNIEATLARNAKRRARKNGAGGAFTSADIRALREKQRGRCAICKNKLESVFHRDHIMPLTRGGSNSIENIQLLCVPCNLSKGAKDPFIYAQERGLLL